MGSRRMRAVLAAQLCALGMGVFATDALARNFPAKPSGNVPAGIPQRDAYTMTVYGARVGGSNGRGLGSIITTPSSEVSLAGRTNVFGGFGDRRPQVPLILHNASRVFPTGQQTGQKFLAVHLGTETYYVGFKSDEERKQYLAELKGTLADMGLQVRPRSEQKAASQTAQVLATPSAEPLASEVR